MTDKQFAAPREEQEKALRKLMKESAAILALAEPELRDACGHTNVAVFKLRIEEAAAALALSTPSPAPMREEPEKAQNFCVTVSRHGESIVTIETSMVSGRDISDEDEETIRTAAQHLLAFIGELALSTPSPVSPEPPKPRLLCTCYEHAWRIAKFGDEPAGEEFCTCGSVKWDARKEPLVRGYVVAFPALRPSAAPVSEPPDGLEALLLDLLEVGICEIPQPIRLRAYRLLQQIRRPSAAPVSEALSQADIITVREAIRALDCGDHYCRYCNARSPDWSHARSCPYQRSVEIADEARKILDRVQAAAPVSEPRQCRDCPKCGAEGAYINFHEDGKIDGCVSCGHVIFG